MAMLLIHLGSVALLALAVEAACRLGKFRPAVCHALWVVVLLKLMTPPVVGWPVDVEVLGSLSWDRAPVQAHTTAPERQSIARGELVGEGEIDSDRAAATSTSGTGALAVYRFPWTNALALLWCVGGVIVTARILREVYRARRRMAASSPLPGWLQLYLDEVARALGMAAPRAVLTRDPGAVHVQIAGRPVLVVSAEALDHVAPAQWRTILTHELAHLKRRDHWVAWGLLAAGLVWWWNPCFWWVRNRVHLFSEMACDAWVVDTHPGERRQYAETMVRIMAMLSGQRHAAPAMGLSVWSAATQERRLWMIMKSKGACRVSGTGAVALAALALVVAPAWLVVGADNASENTPKAPSPPENTTQTEDGTGAAPAVTSGWTLSLEPTDEIKEKSKTLVTVEFEDVHIKDIIEFLQDMNDVNIVLDGRAVAPEPLSPIGQPAAFGPGLPPPSEPVRPGAFVVGQPVSGPPQPGFAPPPAPSAPPEEVPDRPLGGEPYASDGMVPFIKLVDTPLLDVLKALARPMNLAVQLRGGCIWVSTDELIIADQVLPLPTAVTDDPAILKRLKGRVNVEFEDIHLADMMAFISKSFKLNVVVDNRVVMPEGGDWNAPPAESPGYATDGVLSYINLKDVPLSDFLYVASRQLNLTYRVETDRVFISTPEIIASGETIPAQ